jgi:hypothetical protein
MAPMRAVIGFSAAVLLALAACTAKTTDDGSNGGGDTGGATTAGNGGGDGGPWGTRTDIEAIFTKDCTQCHADTWSSCWNVHASAEAIEPDIQYNDMPRGMPMAPNDKAAVLAWLNEGAPCVGPEPDGGSQTWTSGSPAPIGEGADSDQP